MIVIDHILIGPIKLVIAEISNADCFKAVSIIKAEVDSIDGHDKCDDTVEDQRSYTCYISATDYSFGGVRR